MAAADAGEHKGGIFDVFKTDADRSGVQLVVADLALFVEVVAADGPYSLALAQLLQISGLQIAAFVEAACVRGHPQIDDELVAAVRQLHIGADLLVIHEDVEDDAAVHDDGIGQGIGGFRAQLEGEIC